MAKASAEEISVLETAINRAAEPLPAVVTKRMFGCHALFVKDSVFGMVWKEGRIGVRLSDAAAFEKLMATAGAAPWKAGDRTMAHWVFVPAKMHGDRAKLSKWLALAYELAKVSGNKPKAKRKAAAGKGKSAKKKVVKQAKAR